MKTKTKNITWGCLGLGILAVLAIVVTGIVIQHIRYRTAGFLPDEEKVPPIVAITAPDEGTQGSPIFVETSAFGHTPFLSMELWINGVLEGVHAAPLGGLAKFGPDFAWIPAQPGAYSLVARALDAENQSAASSPVIVLINPVEFEEEVDKDTTDVEADTPDVFPAAGPATAPISLSVPGDSVGPAGSWQGSASEWITNLTSKEAPNAPALLVQSEGCSAKLSIHDLSDNEEGFAVYRQTPNAPAWDQIALLSSQSQKDWLTFSDSGVPGGVTYYVSAFNSQGESTSNLALVNIDPEDCPPAEGEIPILTIELANLVPSLPVDQAYCYKSLDGIHWSRWPQSGFLAMGEQGLEIQEDVGNHLLSDLDGQPVIQEIDLMMECWGWSGAELQFVGEFSEHIDLSGPTELHIPTDGFSVDVLLKFADYLKQPILYPMGGGDDDIFFDPQLFKEILKHYKPIHPQMVQVFAYPTLHLEECLSHLQAPWMTKFGKLIYCAPFPGFDTGSDGVNPQPYLVWFFEESCQSGEDCLSYEDLLALADGVGGKVGFNITDSSSAGFNTWVIDKSRATAFVIPPVSCEGKRTFRVQMWLSMFGQTYWSPISQPSELKCFEPIGDTTEVEVTFQTLVIGHADDNDWGEEDLEIYGYFLAESSVDFKYVVRGVFSDWHKNCGDESFGGLQTGGTKGLGCTEIVSDGSYSIAQFENCIDSTKGIKVCRGSIIPGLWAKGKNKVTIDVGDGDAIHLRVVLFDYDTSSGDDQVCVAEINTTKKDIFEWNKTNQETWHLSQPNNGNASCKVYVVINGLKPWLDD